MVLMPALTTVVILQENENGIATRMIGAAEDITERKKYRTGY